MRGRQMTDQGEYYIIFFCILFIVMRQVYLILLYQNCLDFHLEVYIIIGSDEVLRNQFLHKEDKATTCPTIFSPPPLH